MPTVLPLFQSIPRTKQFTRNLGSESFKFDSIQGVSNHMTQIVAGDVVFLAPFILQNVVSGSQYWIAQTGTLSNVLATGTSSGTDISISMSCYSDPMSVTIRVRKPGYIAFETLATVTRSGGSSYVIQTVDPTA